MNSFKLTKENAQRLAQKYVTPLEVVSTKHIEMNYEFLHHHIPRLKIFYAIKSNPADCILRKMMALGSNFDVASAGEINKLASLGVTGDRMIYANPVKSPEGIRAAIQAGITKFTFDSENEIDKLVRYIPKEKISNMEVLARMKVDHSDAVVNLNLKFGADKHTVLHLLQYAQEKGLKSAGLCFHVGSQTASSHAYLGAFADVRKLIDETRQNGIEIKYVDIGGGLPAPALHTDLDIAQIMNDINDCIERDFTDVEVWAEPGRYMCASAVNVLTSVLGKQVRDGKDWYYLDDGIYGSFSGVMFDHWDYDLTALKSGELSPATLAGPTCDSIDIVKKNMMCPQLETGDLLLAINAGAYSTVGATTFNGFELPRTIEWEAEDFS